MLLIHERGTLYSIVLSKLLSSYNTHHNLDHNKVILQHIVQRKGLMRGVSANCQNISWQTRDSEVSVTGTRASLILLKCGSAESSSVPAQSFCSVSSMKLHIQCNNDTN